ncbi:glycoside hydrolase family 28 protein [Spirillospora sp. NPDC048911]|uniref:rhamnogalacturonidase n=1 Tax=Spirillospora sp. NPDC048911 TaxID=3364527 RepID=UPI0037135A8D
MDGGTAMGALWNRRQVLGTGVAGLGMGVAGLGLAVPGHASVTGRRPVFDVRSFGAKGDGVTIDSAAIDRAIEKAAEEGPATVYFPPGVYASYSIHLQSRVTLYLERGARLLAARPTGTQGYDPAEPGAGNPYQDFGHSHWHNSLIWGEGLTDIALMGHGVIDGSGLVSGGSRESAPLQGNKAISLKLCRRVVIRDLTLFNCGHFGILPTGVDDFVIRDLTIDTNRDGINIDCCHNVKITGCVVNSPNDDAIVLKSSYGLNEARLTRNVRIADCRVSGYDLGTLLDGTKKVGPYGRTGRVKLGTESNGGFRNVLIEDVAFEHCRGLALETVDGGLLDNVVARRLTMDQPQMPFFLRLGARMRGPAGVPVGRLRNVEISDVTTVDADPRYPSTISGIPGHDIENVRISNVRHRLRGGLTPADANSNPPELETAYPEPSMFGTLPAFGFFVRHARNIELDRVDIAFDQKDIRPAIVLRDAAHVRFAKDRCDKVPQVPTFVLDDVDDFTVTHTPPVPDTHKSHADHLEL